VSVGSNSLVTLVVISISTSPVFPNSGTDVQHLGQISLFTFQRSRSRSKYKVKIRVLNIFHL